MGLFVCGDVRIAELRQFPEKKRNELPDCLKYLFENVKQAKRKNRIE